MRKPSAAVLAEREACARIAAEEREHRNAPGPETAARIEHRIRARSISVEEWLEVDWNGPAREVLSSENQRRLALTGYYSKTAVGFRFHPSTQAILDKATEANKGKPIYRRVRVADDGTWHWNEPSQPDPAFAHEEQAAGVAP